MKQTDQTDIRQIIQQRAALYQTIRGFFQKKQVLEVQTPILSPFASTDVHLDSFKTHWGNQPMYLHTSPELAMKRLLAMGVGDCYQLCPVFRNESQSRHHRPEFSLLEWYRLGFGLADLMAEVAELVKTACPDWQGLAVVVVSYAEAFADFGIDPHRDDLPTLKAKIHQHSDFVPALSDNKSEWLDFFWVTQIEKYLGDGVLTFITHYPASMAALAKITDDEHGNAVAERFELYYRGIELANGFDELTDSEEQRLRFAADNRARVAMGKPEMPMDTAFIKALKKGLPACAGVALGVDRLLMLKRGVRTIDDVMF